MDLTRSDVCWNSKSRDLPRRFASLIQSSCTVTGDQLYRRPKTVTEEERSEWSQRRRKKERKGKYGSWQRKRVSSIAGEVMRLSRGKCLLYRGVDWSSSDRRYRTRAV